jgi:hypothetical protein
MKSNEEIEIVDAGGAIPGYWTPVIKGADRSGWTPHRVDGHYTKVGNVVTFKFDIAPLETGNPKLPQESSSENS